jgi:UDP-GlcNAc:undecaprenyl-phosphate/decaprenyl-phosphate GlcNAc-1-phosphate transferase
LIGIAYFAFFATAFVLSMTATRYVRDVALRYEWVRPKDRRHHTHSGPVPRLGGIGIFVGFSLSLAMLVAGYHFIHHNPVYITGILQKLGPPALLIFFLGLADDIYDVHAWVKFAVQIIAALVMFFEGMRVNPHVFGGHPFGSAASLVFTVLWVVGITNAFNLIDGLDGLAAGSALFSTMAVFIVGVIAGDRTMAIITVGLTGAIFGFLRFNFIPATIFLGDSGSLFIGFMLSAISLGGSQKSPTLVAVAIPVVACGLPIIDTAIAVARRFLSGKPIFGADKEHIHHKLMNRGLTQRQAVIVLYGISALCAFMSLFLLYPGAGTAGIVLAVLGIGAWLGLQQLDYREVTELKRLARRTIDQRRIISNNLAVQYATEHFPTASSIEDVVGLLRDMFAANDFDAFQLELLKHRAPENCFIWEKPDAEKDAVRWSMVFDLRTSDGIEYGKLTIYRAFVQRPLLIDVNLLTAEFYKSLVAALVRTIDAPLTPVVEVATASKA